MSGKASNRMRSTGTSPSTAAASPGSGSLAILAAARARSFPFVGLKTSDHLAASQMPGLLDSFLVLCALNDHRHTPKVTIARKPVNATLGHGLALHTRSKPEVVLDAVMGPALSGQLMWLSSDR